MFAAGEGGEGVEGGAWVRVGVEAEVAFGSDAAPVAGEEGAAEEVGPDGEVVEAPFIALGSDADEAGVVGEEGELVGRGHGEGLSGGLGFIRREVYQRGCYGGNGNCSGGAVYLGLRGVSVTL